MSRPMLLVPLFLALAAATSCTGRSYGPSITTPVTQAPRDIDELTVAERHRLLDRAEVFEPIDTARLDLLQGPAAKDGFPPNARVTCVFDFPKSPLSGMTPKFECEIAPKDVVKVKYGEDNGEVYAEVAGSRLFWALGFFADRMYPVVVTCVGCPKDPYRASTTEWRLGRPGNVSTRVFELATIERKFDGKKIEVPRFEGWSWHELEGVADNTVGATRAHIDALKLLAAFIQHVDSKPDNQALLCADDSLSKDSQGNETCARPVLVVKDLGSSFAAASRVRFLKMNLESWRGVKVWRNKDRCQANLTSSLVGTLSHPRINEAGRNFLAHRLSLLTDKQLHDLFTAARVDRRNQTVDGRPVTVGDWVEVFKAKRAEIVEHRCPSDADN